MPDRRFSTAANGPATRAVDRKTVLTGAAGALVGTTLGRPSPASARAASAESATAGRFDPVLAGRLRQVLEGAVARSKGAIPGAILHVERAGGGSWAGTAGLGRLHPAIAIRPGDRFRAGSIVKPFVSATVLQLAERGRLPLEATLPEVLPADVTGRFPTAPRITVRMLLGHRAGLPEWNSPAVEAAAARNPSKIWQPSELLDIAAAKKPLFAPGTRYAYSNTDYTLLGLAIEHATDRSWRQEVTDRVLRPAGLEASVLPSPGNLSPVGPYAHGYIPVDGTMLDISLLDPSMAGPAGGHALVTTAHDLVRFLDALLAGRLFRRRETLQSMLAFRPASSPDQPGVIGYGLGLEHRVVGGAHLIDHLGGAGGYFSYVGRLPGGKITFAAAMNSSADPSPLFFPVFQTLARARR